ncbi:MAG: dTMP kinase [Planctomycetaceae bacterium]
MSFLVDIEGIDGSGKGTQARLLCDRLVQSGVTAGLISFPRYEATFFGRAIGEFLNGWFGTLQEVHPLLVSLLFAGDRFESKQVLLDALDQSEVVVLDRYVASNVAHQAAKLEGAERADLARRILQLEFEIYGLPRPDLVLLFDLPVQAAQSLIERKAERAYTAQAADLQEADAEYLARVRELYLELAATDSRCRVVSCVSAGQLRSVDEIADEVWAIVQATRTA